MTPRIAVVGAGAMGARHARVIAQSGRAELTMVVDPRDAGREIAVQFGASWAPHADGLPDDVDAVVVAVPTEAHFEIAARLLNDGIATLVEKPVTSDLASLDALLESSRRNDAALMCGLLERFNPAVLTARPLISDPVHIAARRHSPYAPRIRTGVAWDLLIHDVDLAISLVGAPPKLVNASTGVFDARSEDSEEDVAELVMKFDAGQVAQVSASRIAHRKIRELSISEVDKLIEVDLLRRDVTIFRNVSDRPASADGRGYRYETVIEIPEIVTSREPLAAQLDHFLDIITGEADAEAERVSLRPAHAAVAAARPALT